MTAHLSHEYSSSPWQRDFFTYSITIIITSDSNSSSSSCQALRQTAYQLERLLLCGSMRSVLTATRADAVHNGLIDAITTTIRVCWRVSFSGLSTIVQICK